MDACAVDAARCQVVAGGFGTAQRQGIIDGVGTRAVGVADDADFRIGVVAQAIRETVQDGSEVGLDISLAGSERDVAGDIQLQLIVCGLGHAHASALGGGFHFRLLLFQVLGPDVGAQCSHASADQRAGASMAAGNGTDGSTAQCANACAGGGAAGGVRHAASAGAASDEQCRGQSGRYSHLFAHRKLLHLVFDEW